MKNGKNYLCLSDILVPDIFAFVLSLVFETWVFGGKAYHNICMYETFLTQVLKSQPNYIFTFKTVMTYLKLSVLNMAYNWLSLFI